DRPADRHVARVLHHVTVTDRLPHRVVGRRTGRLTHAQRRTLHGPDGRARLVRVHWIAVETAVRHRMVHHAAVVQVSLNNRVTVRPRHSVAYRPTRPHLHTLSLHDALPICDRPADRHVARVLHHVTVIDRLPHRVVGR